jgi:hypothetical protein
MAKELTTIALEKLRAGPKRREIPDGRIGGLYHIIQPSGKRSCALRYRFAGKPRNSRSRLLILRPLERRLARPKTKLQKALIPAPKKKRPGPPRLSPPMILSKPS